MIKTLNEKHAKVNVICNDSIHSSDFFQSQKQAQKCVDLFAVGIHENYQRRGMATKLVQESIKVRPFLKIFFKFKNPF